MEEAEYLRTRTVTDFIAWIDEVNVARQGTTQSNAYREREGLWKKYADEAEPLARFLRGSTSIPRTASITMGQQDELPDAVIEIDNSKISVEVTTTDHPGAVHNRRQLNEHGFGPGETNFILTGKDLATQRAQGNPRDFGRPMNAVYLQRQELDRLLARIRNKQEKIYPLPPLLIVDSCSTALIDLTEAEVRDYLITTNPPGGLREIWVCIYPGRVFKLG